MMPELLSDRLNEYCSKDFYPFHMPGHKRRSDFLDIDVTEIDGFDDLHHQEGILRDLTDEATELYGSRQTFYLVNGCTCGILSALYATAHGSGGIVMARNSHKAAYHGAALTGQDLCYIYPRMTDYSLFTGIETKDIPLDKIKDNTVVFITSPTYDGIISDVEGIADAVHERGGVLVVDEAHGAHLPFGDRFPKSAIYCGADVVLQSLHKTLPAMTQTAVMHVCSNRVDIDRVAAALDIFESSSPSYILMSSIADCIRYMKLHGSEAVEALSSKLDRLYSSAADLTHVKLVTQGDLKTEPPYDFDRSKLSIYGDGIYEKLIDGYHIQPEMDAMDHALLISGIMDTDEGFERLISALIEIDRYFESGSGKKTEYGLYTDIRPQISVPISEAVKLPGEWVDIEKATGMISASYIYFYPPGIPVAVPGEVFDRDLITYIKETMKKGPGTSGGGFKNGKVLTCRYTV